MEEKNKISKKIILYFIGIGLVSFLLGTLVMIIPEETGPEDNFCNVMVLSLNGVLATYLPPKSEDDSEMFYSSENVLAAIEKAENDPDVKGLILSINSPGGDIVAGEEIANALKAMKKPNVAVIRNMGASAAFLASSGADRVYASKLSDTVGIGVTMSYTDQTEKNRKEGLTFNQLSTGKFKDAGDPDKPLTEEEKLIFMIDLEKAHKIFVEEIAQNRNLKIEDVSKISTGRTYLGEEALNFGLIDEIGSIDTAVKYIESLTGEKAETCWY
ncbi:MAG: hypothetical protein A2431_00235 [Candidatus Zambryskibacteria bacterium RIFOXYC1_FULL_39_10]|uniref:Peptidase S49 domain-containing protein n=1 Tax=Candidatus Zambryskibacteria bacterium RIFOXYC1_FULL_39_10 TaxID=1802779 RepID=A0A1G2UZE5_9BACT|nr:MAG: hypothetical protein A2431_00235 [Candidatus Zambryskibacteria bacterium RIFOXYC1_FULL_39_10]OHB15976.1 MAG: hypothetical protein A2605_03775 [Candidatus Zambryskibacteria bacterium RIFOXYD1_FULL_39_35]